MFLGLRTVIYPAPNLEEAVAWWSKTLGVEPYFNQPYYVGFNLGGYELGLDPHGPVEKGPITYWGVENAEKAAQQLKDGGVKEYKPVRDVGEGIKVGEFIELNGALFGIIENPHFSLPS